VVALVALAFLLVLAVDEELPDEPPHAASRRQARMASSAAAAAGLRLLRAIRDMKLLVDDRVGRARRAWGWAPRSELCSLRLSSD
jgi:hypothetical protein